MNKSHLSLLFTLFTTTSLLCSAAPPAPVLDIYNKPLLAGTSYLILPVIDGRGGGVTLATSGNKTCPLHVIQEPLESTKGLPLTFLPVNSKKGPVRISTDHNIKFSTAPTCVKSRVWKASYDESTQNFFVTIGGVEGKPGRDTLDNWFKIEEYDGDYKFVFCPTVCNYCKVVCKNVGILVQDGMRRLVLTDNAPFKIMFIKA